MKFLVTAEKIFIIIISLNNISLRFDEETKKLMKPVLNKLTRKQDQCA
jgi:hypothetical protein